MSYCGAHSGSGRARGRTVPGCALGSYYVRESKEWYARYRLRERSFANAERLCENGLQISRINSLLEPCIEGFRVGGKYPLAKVCR